MNKEINISGYSDEELVAKYSVLIDGKRYVPSKISDAIGRRHAEIADRKPGDPGTIENPIFKDGHAYVFSSTNRLIIWEDYKGLVPLNGGITININPETMDGLTLTQDMKPTDEQKEMIQKVSLMPVKPSEDCPKLSTKHLKRLRPAFSA